MLVDGQWTDRPYDTTKGGAFVRQESRFRSFIRADGRWIEDDRDRARNDGHSGDRPVARRKLLPLAIPPRELALARAHDQRIGERADFADVLEGRLESAPPASMSLCTSPASESGAGRRHKVDV